ncbi:MAG: ATP-binding cassette domain-containing protein [Bacteroidetes bacterium]|jgi:ABC-2 type transport system ATP-binding protein|nr:ATP-binding cassette domain-containing protein [Bacteroidota bacterium]
MLSKILEVDGITKDFQSVRAVDRLSFQVHEGEIFALLGPNGAGKTTAARMLLGIVKPDSGSIRYALAEGANGRVRAGDLGYLPEDRGLYKDMPIQRTLVYMGILRGMTRQAATAAAGTWLEKIGLHDRASDKLETLSKGNQQKVQFVSSILHAPAFAVLDEPFSGLDPINQDFFVEVIRSLRDGGTTVLLSAHQMDLVERLADRVLLMNHGREVLQGTITSIKEKARSTHTVLVTVDGPADLDAIRVFPAVVEAERMTDGRLALHLKKGERLNELLAAVASKVTITAVHSQPVTLHEIYVQTVRADSARQHQEGRS